MNTKKTVLALVALALLTGGAYAFTRAPQEGSKTVVIPLQGKEIVVYKTPTCGCCGVYVSYLKKLHASMRSENVANLDDIKREHSVPVELASCHTSVVDGYVIEGHVPIEAIEKLLAERPAVKGIALPGMPSGTPGMPGPKTEAWDIYSFTEDGTTSIFTTI
jgi:hypothetical protein